MENVQKPNPTLLYGQLLVRVCGATKQAFEARWSPVPLRAAYLQIIKPAFPTLVSIWCASIVGISDACIAGRIGTDSLAAMAFCEQFWFLLSLITTALAAAVSMGMAQCRASVQGANRENEFLANSLCAAALSGLAILIASLTTAFIFHQHHGWFNGNAKLVADYFQICAFSMLPFALLQVQCAALRTLDQPKQIVTLWIAATLTEIILANIFVNCGWRSLAALAGAWTIACLVASAQGGVYLLQAMPSLSWRDFTQTTGKQKREDLRTILQLGLPIALSESGILASSYLNLQIISSLPAAQTMEAAWAIRTRLEEFAEFAPTCAIGIAVSTFAAKHDPRGNLPGDKNARRNQATISVLLSAVALTVAAAVCFCLLALLISPALVHNFSQDLLVEKNAALVLSISSLAWPLFAVAQLLFSSLAATGKGHVASIATLVCLLPLRFGLAMLLKDQPCLPAIAGVTISGVMAQGALAGLTAILFFNGLSPIFSGRKSAIFLKPGT